MAFRCNTDFAEVMLPEGVTELDYNAFYGFPEDATVNIPLSVSKIHDNAFSWARAQSLKFDPSVAFVTRLYYNYMHDEINVPYIRLPSPVDPIKYKRILNKHPEIKYLYVHSDTQYFSKISVDDFLNIITEVYESGYIYTCREESNGKYSISPFSASKIVISNGKFSGALTTYKSYYESDSSAGYGSYDGYVVLKPNEKEIIFEDEFNSDSTLYGTIVNKIQ